MNIHHCLRLGGWPVILKGCSIVWYGVDTIISLLGYKCKVIAVGAVAATGLEESGSGGYLYTGRKFFI